MWLKPACEWEETDTDCGIWLRYTMEEDDDWETWLTCEEHEADWWC